MYHWWLEAKTSSWTPPLLSSICCLPILTCWCWDWNDQPAQRKNDAESDRPDQGWLDLSSLIVPLHWALHYGQCTYGSDSVIIPVQCEYFALEGLGNLLNTIKMSSRAWIPPSDIEGILLTMYDNRLSLAKQVVEDVKTHFQQMVFNTIINRNTKLGEAPSFGLTIMMHDINSSGAINYLNLARRSFKKNDLTRLTNAEKWSMSDTHGKRKYWEEALVHCWMDQHRSASKRNFRRIHDRVCHANSCWPDRTQSISARVHFKWKWTSWTDFVYWKNMASFSRWPSGRSGMINTSLFQVNAG